jgi:drug/metabolite transporter (DMT)-like permease
MLKKRSSVYGPILALLFISLIWGFNWVILKQSLRYAGPHDFNAIRLVLGSLFLFAFLAWKKKPLCPPFPLWTVILGICQTTLGTGLILMALENGGAGKTAILVYTMPFWILLLARLVLDERLRGALWVPVIMALCGLVFILEPWAMGGTSLSKYLAVLSGVCWAAGAIIVKLLGRGRRIDLIRLTTWQLIFGTAPLALLALVTPAPPIEWSPFFIGSILYNAILVCGIAFLLWTYLFDRLPAGIAGLGTLAVPVIGITASRFWFGEEIGSWEGWGIVLILAGLALLSIIRLRESRPADPVLGQD